MRCERFNDWASEQTLARVASLVTEYETERGRPDRSVTYQSIQDWIKKGIPPTRVLCVEHLSKIPRHELRPDIYPPEANGSAA